MMGEIRFNVWLSLDYENRESRFQFLQPGEGVYALPGAVVIGHMLEGPTDGLYLWQPKPKWRDVPRINIVIARQWDSFTKFIRAASTANLQ